MTSTRQPNTYGLRIPPALRAKLQAAADVSGRSLNSEILHRLEGSFEEASTEARLRKVEDAIKSLSKGAKK